MLANLLNAAAMRSAHPHTRQFDMVGEEKKKIQRISYGEGRGRLLTKMVMAILPR